MFELTQSQCQELVTSNPVAINPITGQQYVLVPAEAYARMQSLLEDDTVYTTAEMLDKVMADDDAGDPYLAELQKKYGGVQ